MSAARRVLVIGIGGGGDVVGALAASELARELGVPSVVGGLTWERRVIDPRPGPRRIEELAGAEPIGPGVALAGPHTSGPGGFHFEESHMAAHLGDATVLVDPSDGPAAIADSLAAAMAHLDCDLLVALDVGGDALAEGDEQGLASPLCDAVMLAAAAVLAQRGTPVLGAIFGAGCDGELTPAEVLGRLSALAAAGGLLGAWGLTPAGVERLAAAVEAVPTEASDQAVRCAQGAVGPASIRGGRSTVERSAVGGLTFFFDVPMALESAAPLARAVAHCRSLSEARDVLAERGVRTELDLERQAYDARPVRER